MRKSASEALLGFFEALWKEGAFRRALWSPLKDPLLPLGIKLTKMYFCKFFTKMLQINFCQNFADFLLNLTNFFRDFPKMQQFGENPKIAHLIFVLEMRPFNFRFEKKMIFIFTIYFEVRDLL